MRNTQLNNHEFHVLANYPSKTASLDAVRAFADVQAQTAIACWQVATWDERELHWSSAGKVSSQKSSTATSR